MSGPANARTAVRAGHAFDGECDVPGGLTVLVVDGRITGVQPAATPPPDGWHVMDFPHATVLPGLIDTHVHLCGDSKNGALDRLGGIGDDELGAVIEEGLRRHVAAGVTTVRDLGDRRWAVLERRDRAVPGDACPTIVAAGPPITSVRGHCWNMGGEARGAAELRAAVKLRSERGVDVVKVMASGGVATQGTDVMHCQFTLDEMRLVVDEAHAAGLAVTAHAHGLPAVEQAIAVGADGIEHCSFMTESGVRASAELFDQLARQNTAVCPTLGVAAGVTPPPAVLATIKRLGLTLEDALALRMRVNGDMHRAGVRLVSGSDGGISTGKAHGILPRAVEDLVTGGIPAADALASATSVAAHECGLGARKGRLLDGYDADLLLVEGDAVRDIGVLERVIAVMVGGRWAIGQPA
ncbi:MAG: amidohydrolase [Pseudonocardia sp.]|nr:amidohydrolase [Pseudonocardia sp.]